MNYVKLLLLSLFIFSCGGIRTPMDKYCKRECLSIYDEVETAYWLGNDNILNKTRCGCVVNGKEETEFLPQRKPNN